MIVFIFRHLLQLFRRMLQHCCVVKLQNCFLDPSLASGGGERIMTEFSF